MIKTIKIKEKTWKGLFAEKLRIAKQEGITYSFSEIIDQLLKTSKNKTKKKKQSKR